MHPYFIYSIIIFIVSAIPLNIAVRLLGGKSSFLKAILVNLIVGTAGYFISTKIKFFATILSFIVLLLIYKVMFRIGWLRALLAWVVQLVIIGIFWLAVFFLLGIMLLV